jgi:hypothetical protein
MTHALYAYMNNKKNLKKKNPPQKKATDMISIYFGSCYFTVSDL